jgi:hypothetical protein
MNKKYNFNWEFYLLKNKDLIYAGINNEKQSFYHWQKYGINEGRLWCDIPIYFNWKTYLQLNIDLTNIIDNEEDAWKHWINCGRKENRIYIYYDYDKINENNVKMNQRDFTFESNDTVETSEINEDDETEIKEDDDEFNNNIKNNYNDYYDNDVNEIYHNKELEIVELVDCNTIYSRDIKNTTNKVNN